MSNDSWRTPDDLFKVLDKGGEFQGIPFQGFNFDIDLAANAHNSKCERFCIDYLNEKVGYTFDSTTIGTSIHWELTESAWMNPPYSNPLPFIQKAWEDSKYCKIVCLVKVDTSTKWWGVFWNYEETKKTIRVPESDFGIGYEDKEIIHKAGPKPGCEVVFFPKRIKFDPPQELVLKGEVIRKVSYCKHCEGYGNAETCDECKHINKDIGWVQRCKYGPCIDNFDWYQEGNHTCIKCKGKGYTTLSGPSFASCLIIMDRRGL